jgi:Peptidase A4 family/MrcB-like, N-terminal domain
VALVPWVRIYAPEHSPTAQEGIYLTYLFAADGSRAYLSLMHGSSEFRSGAMRAISDQRTLLARAAVARSALGVLAEGDIAADAAHPEAIGKGAWVSPGLRHNNKVAGRNGTVTEVQSANWSGFADSQPTSSTSTFSSASGTWVIPRITCATRPYQNSDVFIANWVGLDGFADGTVEQLGSGAQCYEDTTFYYVWYEMYPQGMVEEGTAACINDNVDCPQPGDVVSASVTVTPGSAGQDNYVLSLTDHSNPQESFSTDQSCAANTCLDTSAEWIIERPATLPPFGIIQILPLAAFHRTRFLSGHTTFGGVSSSIGGFAGPVDDIAMSDDTASYLLDCVGQQAPPGTLISAITPTACPVVAPRRHGGFSTTFDAGF